MNPHIPMDAPHYILAQYQFVHEQQKGTQKKESSRQKT
jgi:hypothetical protein